MTSFDSLYSMYGVKLVVSPFLTKKQTGRVKGGYCNHWLIRAEVEVPVTIYIPEQNTVYLSPLAEKMLKDAMGPKFPSMSMGH